MIELPDNASIVATYPREFHIKHLYATHLYRVNTGLDTPELVAYLCQFIQEPRIPANEHPQL